MFNKPNLQPTTKQKQKKREREGKKRRKFKREKKNREIHPNLLNFDNYIFTKILDTHFVSLNKKINKK
jgi:hypothetical protein